MTDNTTTPTAPLHERTRIEGDLAYLTLTKGYTAVIDAADVELVGRYAWTARVRPHGVYAFRKVRSGSKPKVVHLHRVLMNPPADLHVDHIDCDPLNNRRSNLRLATNSQNQWNSKRYRNNTSGFKGVSFHKNNNKWAANIQHNGKQRHLGNFDSPEEAHAAYCKAAEEFFGEFARAA